MNFCTSLWLTADQYPEKTALVFGDQRPSYAELKKNVSRTARILQSCGVKPGDRVGLQASKSLETVYFHLACLHVGAVVLPMNDGYKPNEVAYCLSDSGARLFVADAGQLAANRKVLGESAGRKIIVLDKAAQGADFYPDLLAGISDRDLEPAVLESDAPAFLCYTSGTTGRPKGAVLTHGNLLTNLGDLTQVWRISPHDVVMHALPLFHVHGLMVCLYLSLLNGATVVMSARFDPKEVWRTMEDTHCTVCMGVPTMYHRLLAAWRDLAPKPDLGSMRVFISGSGPLLAVQFERFHKEIGLPILERYGMTETIMITSNPYDPDRRVPGSVGYPLPSVTLRIMDDRGNELPAGQTGEVCLQGGNVFKEYWGNRDKTRESYFGDWFRTGDLGYLDPNDDLRLYLVGRARELIISGGYNVYPKEVENRLEQHPAVKESAVVGLPDEDFGERVTAAVVLRRGSRRDEENIIAYCKETLAGYKCPKEVHFLDELPRNSMGKILKEEVKKLVSG